MIGFRRDVYVKSCDVHAISDATTLLWRPHCLWCQLLGCSFLWDCTTLLDLHWILPCNSPIVTIHHGIITNRKKKTLKSNKWHIKDNNVPFPSSSCWQQVHPYSPGHSTEGATYLGLPRSAAWCSALKPLLLDMPMSAPCSSSILSMSSRFLLMASCSGVSPSLSWCQKKNVHP